MNDVTEEQVREAALAARLYYIPIRACSLCGSWVHYVIQGDELHFDPSCDCTYGGGLEPRSWQDAADWINMQSNPQHKRTVAALFGLHEESARESAKNAEATEPTS